jgi:hypothetical protein
VFDPTPATLEARQCSVQFRAGAVLPFKRGHTSVDVFDAFQIEGLAQGVEHAASMSMMQEDLDGGVVDLVVALES